MTQDQQADGLRLHLAFQLVQLRVPGHHLAGQIGVAVGHGRHGIGDLLFGQHAHLPHQIMQDGELFIKGGHDVPGGYGMGFSVHGTGSGKGDCMNCQETI